MSCKSCEKQYNYEAEVCPALGVQDVVVGVPVEIKPFAKVGRVKTECMGKPIIKRGPKECEGKPRCTCKFTVSQKIRVVKRLLQLICSIFYCLAKLKNTIHWVRYLTNSLKTQQNFQLKDA